VFSSDAVNWQGVTCGATTNNIVVEGGGDKKQILHHEYAADNQANLVTISELEQNISREADGASDSTVHDSQDGGLNASADPRRSKRMKKKPPLSTQFKGLFLTPYVAGSVFTRNGRVFRVIHTNPNIFLVDSFLTPVEIQHIKALAKQAEVLVCCFIVLVFGSLCSEIRRILQCFAGRWKERQERQFQEVLHREWGWEIVG
jgi:hypothetical protein